MKHIVIFIRSNTPVLVFCNSNVCLVQRLLAELAGIEYSNIKEGNLSGEEWERIDNAAPILENAPLYICDKEIDTAEGYIKEIEDSSRSVEYVFIDAMPDNIDKEKLILWSEAKGISLEFPNFDDELH